MTRFKEFVFLILIFSGYKFPGVLSDLPIIYPTTFETVIIDDMSLGCESQSVLLDANVSFKIPDNGDYWTDSNFNRRIINDDGEYEALPKYYSRTPETMNTTYMNVTDVDDTSKKNPSVLLSMKNFTVNDVGYYHCHYQGFDYDDNQNARKIFVYLKDSSRLSFLPKNKTYILNERLSSNNITFPCIPITPNVTVILKASSLSRKWKSDTELSSEIATFSSRKGFSLKITETNFDKFICEFTKGKDENFKIEHIYFKVRFEDFFEYHMEPFINYTDSHFIQKYDGDTLKLTCAIATDSVNSTSLIWDIPNKSNPNVKIDNVNITLTNGYFYASTLQIRFLSNEDAGKYICKTNDSTINDYFAMKYVSIDPYNMTPIINASAIYKIIAGDDLILACEGQPNIKWTVPEYKEENSNVSISSEKLKNNEIRVVLKITNASYYDTGYYYCHEENSPKNDPNLSKQIFVYVDDEYRLMANNSDNITLHAWQYSNVTIPCIPTSPDIKVILFDNLTLQYRPEEYISETGFIVYLPEDDLLNFICSYIRVYGNGTNSDVRERTQKIIVDVERSFKYENIPFISTPDNVFSFIGGDLSIFCAVIVQKHFTPNISWDSPNDEDFKNQTQNITEANFMISNGKVVISTLTIKDVRLGDYREYECAFLDERNRRRFDRKAVALNIEFDIKPYIETPRSTGWGGTLSANCTVRADHNIRFEMEWFLPNDPDRSRVNISDTHVTLDVYGNLGNNTLMIYNTQYEDAGNYTCKVTDHKNNTNEESVWIFVRAPSFPNFTESNLKNETKIVPEGTPFDMICTIDKFDIPTPSISWYKNNILIPGTNGLQEFSITYIQRSDIGVYSCNVTNWLGNNSNWVNLQIESDSPGILTYVWVVIPLLIFFFVLIAFFAVRIMRERRFQNRLKTAGLVDFAEGQVKNLNPNIFISDQAELLPYDTKWEVPKDRVKIGKQLGCGHFGVVMKGEIWGVFPGETIKTVAIKMLHKNADYPSIKALVNELKIMTYMGKNVNIVNLLGACTKNIKKREILIITEYCLHGNILNYLLKNRDIFVNQIDPETGLIDIDNIDPEMYKKVIPSEEELAKLMNPYVNIDDSAKEKKFCKSKDYKSKIKEAKAEIKEYEANKPTQITTHDLVCWSFQVARGMEYLSSRRILHGDLAARNVLLLDCNIVKICDFGLSKNMYKYRNYKKKTKIPLPVKWMALESVRDRVFSVQSDVWSFGITLWEFFSLSRTPYPGMEPDGEFIKELEKGLRMEQPEFATSDIYEIMKQCWEEKPTDRPNFTEIVAMLGCMVHEGVRKHYIELNKPYENLNITECAPNYDETEEETATENQSEETQTESDIKEEICETEADAAIKENNINTNCDNQIRKRIKSNVYSEVSPLAE